MNKESLANQLVCMLDVNSMPGDQFIAEFKRLIESFFIAGAQRIDLIGKVMDLDNEIGGYNYDIPLLEETQDAITNLSQSEGICFVFKATDSQLLGKSIHV